MNTNKIYKKSHEYLQVDKNTLQKEDIQILENLIADLANFYYNEENPVIADSEYDELLKILEYLEAKFFITEKKSELIGSQLRSSNLKKVAHSRAMISLGNTYNEQDLQDFDTRIERILGENRDKKYMLEFKFDGLGVELIYKKGLLKQAITRGNGLEGEDVTENVMQIQNIPKTIDFLEDIEIRGEVLMPISSFELLNQKAKKDGTKIFSNPRNAASGSLRVLDSSITKKRNLKFFAYDVGDFEIFGFQSYKKMIKKLEKLGFEVSSYFESAQNIKQVIQKIKNFGERKKSLDFEIDGLVIKIDDITLWKKIGYTQHHPRYAIAYKFPAEIVSTKIIDIEHSVGRTGTITPVAHLEPVNIGGAIITRSTLHNYDEVQKLGVKIGDKVFLKRAGEVIPKIISVIENVRDGSEVAVDIPKNCPSCKTIIEKDEGKVRYYCPNSKGCHAQISETFAFAAGKNGFDIDGLGEKQVLLFLEKGFIKTLDDIFSLENFREKILELPGYKEKSVEKLLGAIKDKKTMPLEIFLRGLAISGVGKKTAKIISQLFSQNSDFLEFDISQEELQNLSDIGPEIAENIIYFFEKEKILIKNLLEKIHIIYPEKNAKNNDDLVFSGKKICITGSFEKYTRDDLIAILEKNGGEFSSSVSKKTDFLLAGEKAGSKLQKARELGVGVLSLEDFFAKI